MPTIAIEFVSAGRRSWMRDYVEKRDEYLAVGVKEYWVIDRFRREMLVYTPGPSGSQEQLVREQDVFETPLCLAFSCLWRTSSPPPMNGNRLSRVVREQIVMITSLDIEIETPSIDGKSAGMRMSMLEFRELESTDIDERFRYELIQGVLVVTPAPNRAERDPNDELGYLLRNHRYHHPQGKLLDATMSEEDIATLPDTMRRADRAIWCGLGRDPDLESDVPAIVVEFVSSGKRNWMRDYLMKRDEYLAIGVNEYWVFDRFRRQMTVFTPGDGQHVVPEHGSYQSPLLPGFILEIDVLLVCSDRWTKKK